MKNAPVVELWYVTGSQHLYGEQALRQVAENSGKIVEALNASGRIPVRIVHKPVLTRPEEIRALCLEANASPNCAGLVLWMAASHRRGWRSAGPGWQRVRARGASGG